jgi:hypothetical protein
VSQVNASAFTTTVTGGLSAAVLTPTSSDQITWDIPVRVSGTEGAVALVLSHAVGVYATITQPLPLTAASLDVDLAPPVVTVGAPSIALTDSGPVSFPVTIADAHLQGTLLAETDITLLSTGTADATVSVSGSGSTYTVTLSNVTGLGSLAVGIGGGVAWDSFGQYSVVSVPSTPVTVAPINHPPVAVADSVVRDVGRVGKISVHSLLANDSDPDAGDTLQIVEELAYSTNGILVSIQDGWVLYLADATTPNTTDSFQYRLKDNHGAETVGTVTINVRDRSALPANAAIVSVTAASPTSHRNLTIKLSVLRNRTYYVYGRDSVNSGEWVRLNNGNSIVATTGSITVLDPNRSNSPTRFYRVEVVP